MDRRITFDVKAHAGFAAGDQHGFAADEARQLGGGHRDLRLGGHRPMHRGGQLLGIRRDQRRAAIDAVIVAFGIDHDRFAEAPRRFDDGANDARGERAFGIVGQHHRAGFGQRRFGKADDRGFAFRAGRVRGFPIGAQQVGGVMLGDEAHLARGWPRVVDHQLGCDRPSLPSLSVSTRPASSLPIRPTKMQCAPSAAMLRATLPAPPISTSLLPTVRTGVGASGEMRVTSP